MAYGTVCVKWVANSAGHAALRPGNILWPATALHEQVSLLLTTTVPFAEWAPLFGGDQRLTAALLDRLTFHAHIVQFAGESYRLRESLKRQAEARRPG